MKTIAHLRLNLTTSLGWHPATALFLVTAMTALLLPLNGVGAPRVVGNRARYPRQLAEYAKAYGKHTWTIKQWVKLGKKSGDLPPLDFPEKMAKWYEQNHKQAAPDCLITLTSSEGNRETSSTTKVPDPESSCHSEKDLSELGGLTPEENVERLRRHLHVAERRLSNALAKGDDGTIVLCQRSYLLVTEAWRKAEDTLVQLRKAAGEWLSRTDVEAEAAWFVELLRQIHETMIRRIKSECGNQVDQRSLEILLEAVEKVRRQELSLFQQLPVRLGVGGSLSLT